MQLAHPWVAFGVEQHSSTRDDPFGRFQRTFFRIFRMVYGDLDAAFRSARAVHAIHTRIEGQLDAAAGPFAAGLHHRANQVDALLWVHATLWDTSLLCFESVVRPLQQGEKRAYYAETKRFAYLFGIPDSVLPPAWEDFDRYVQQMLASDVLSVAEPAARMATFLFQPPVSDSNAMAKRDAFASKQSCDSCAVSGRSCRVARAICRPTSKR